MNAPTGNTQLQKLCSPRQRTETIYLPALSACTSHVRLWSATRSLYDLQPQKLWKSRKMLIQIWRIRDRTSHVAELGIELRPKVEYLFFQLQSLSYQNHPLQWGTQCLALLTNGCNPAVVQEMSLPCAFMDSFYKKIESVATQKEFGKSMSIREKKKRTRRIFQSFSQPHSCDRFLK